MKHVMIDIETLGTRPSSVLLTVGAVKFDPNTDQIGDQIHLKFDTAQQFSMNRTADADTLDWWQLQSSEVREAAMGGTDRLHVVQGLSKLAEFVSDSKTVWAQGPQFDIVLLESLYRTVNNPIPWKYNSIRDCRTVLDLIGDNRPSERADAHDAVADCVCQIKALQWCFRELKTLKGSVSNNSWSGVDRQSGAFDDSEIIERNTWT